MNESILNSIKKLLGSTEEYNYFDVDVMMNINSVFSKIGQICTLLPAGFTISGPSETWDDYLKDVPDPASVEFVKTYVYRKVKLAFDPPTGSVLDALKESILEDEWRLSVADNV